MDERNVERLLKQRVEDAIPVLLPGGAVVFAELKRPGEQPRQRQVFVQSQFRKLGFKVAGCVDSPEAVNQVVCMCLMISGQAQLKTKQKPRRGSAATQEAAGSFADEPVLMPGT